MRSASKKKEPLPEVSREEFRIELVTYNTRGRCAVNVWKNNLPDTSYPVDKPMTMIEAIDFVLVMERLKKADT